MNFLINLYLSFFKIGLFGFGGGYAMISLIQQELTRNNWLKFQEFVDIIAIAQMTPGPIAINSATFVGYKTSNIIGSAVATLAVITPSFILVLSLAYFFKKIKESNYVNLVMKYLRITVIGLITIAAFSIAQKSNINIKAIILMLSVIILMYKTEIHPIMIIVMSGVTGILFF